jgi:ketosteroid isomerase-like protein
MKNILVISTLVIALGSAAFAQTAAEQEILKIHAGLDQAFVKQDLAYFERTLADDYVYSDPYGKAFDRAGNLAQLRKEWADATYKVLSATTDNPKVRIMGNTALVTADWNFSSTAKEVANAEPHVDKGRYTGVYEKRAGNWMLIAEHFSEAPHDRKLMEQQVMKAGLEYARIIKTQDAAAIEGILADEYLYTDESGKVKNKAEDIAGYKTGDAKFELAEISDQKVRIIGNGSAVETGTFRIKGTNKGKAFDQTERYTTVWVWRDGRWRVVADHVSELKK